MASSSLNLSLYGPELHADLLPTGASLPQVCALPHPVFKVTATQLVTHENVKTSFRDLR